MKIAKRKGIKFRIPIARLHDVEHGVTPSIYRTFTLSQIYNIPLDTILGWYGVPNRKR